MEQLLEIKSIPMSFELRINPASLEYVTNDPAHRMTRDPSELTISQTSAQLKIDTLEARSSMGFKTAARASRESASASLRDALEATAQIVRDGNRLMEVQNGVTVPSLIKSKIIDEMATRYLQFTVGAIPSAPAEFGCEPARLSMDYKPDELHFEWRTSSRPKLKFTPASVEFRITEFPRLEVEYKGKPLYVPPSASPDYRPRFEVVA